MVGNEDRLKRLIERRMHELDIPSIRELERRAGLTQDVVRNILRGLTKSVRADSVEPLARALKVSVAEIIGAQGGDAQSKALARASVLRVYQNAPLEMQRDGKAPIVSMVAIEGEVAGVQPDPATDYFLLVDDDSMSPTFSRGDAVLIRADDTKLQPRQIYLIASDAAASPILRRVNLRLSDGLLDVTADNDTFPAEIGVSSEKLSIIGRALLAVTRL